MGLSTNVITVLLRFQLPGPPRSLRLDSYYSSSSFAYIPSLSFPTDWLSSLTILGATKSLANINGIMLDRVPLDSGNALGPVEHNVEDL